MHKKKCVSSALVRLSHTVPCLLFYDNQDCICVGAWACMGVWVCVMDSQGGNDACVRACACALQAKKGQRWVSVEGVQRSGHRLVSQVLVCMQVRSTHV